MTVPDLDTGDPIDEVWVDAVATDTNANTAKLGKIGWGKVTAGATDAAGRIIVSHGLGFTPTGVVATSNKNNASQCLVDAIGASTFRVQLFSAAGALTASTTVDFSWAAFTP